MVVTNLNLLQYENVFKGLKVLIFAPGSSIIKYKKLDNEDEFIKIGVKQSILYRDDYDFYMFGDRNVRSKEYEDNIKSCKSTKFCLATVDNKQSEALYNPYEARVKFKANPVCLRGFGDGDKFSIDIARQSYSQCTTTHAAINFSLFAGVRDIYLIGCDGSESKDFRVENNTPSAHHKRMWVFFDKYFNFPDVKYTFINPVNVFTKSNYFIICQ
jgi:hypothetical protein